MGKKHIMKGGGSEIQILPMLLSILLALGIIYMLFKVGKEIMNNYNKSNKHNNQIHSNDTTSTTSTTLNNNIIDSATLWYPNYPYNNMPVDLIRNPYMPPLRDERYLVPINVPTNIGAVDTTYRQLGILTPLNGQKKDNILPLMGRPLFVNRNKWQYYAISNQHNNVKLPLLVKGRTALTDTGVDEIYTGDTVYTEGYNEPFQVTLYDNDTIRYL